MNHRCLEARSWSNLVPTRIDILIYLEGFTPFQTTWKANVEHLNFPGLLVFNKHQENILSKIVSATFFVSASFPSTVLLIWKQA
jgi:hypothetical protein